MSAGCSEPFSKNVPAAVVLDGARDGLLKSIGAKLGSEPEIIGGREIVFELKGEQGIAHVFWLNHRVIAASAIPVSAFGVGAAKRFLDSVQLTEQP